MRKLLIAVALALASTPALAETQSSKQQRLARALSQFLPASQVQLLQPMIANALYYDTAAELLAVSPTEGVLGYAIDTDAGYLRTGSAWTPLPKAYTTHALLFAASPTEGTVAYAVDTNTSYLRSGSSWIPLDNQSIEWSMTFNEGASKGLTLQAITGATYSTTADAYNVVTYGAPPLKFHFVTNTTATGTITPAAEALGIDLNGGSPGDNDEWTATFGQLGSTGGPAIIGTSPAFKACAEISVHDVTGTDGLWVMVASAGTHVDLSSGDPNYASYCAIGLLTSGSVYVSDNTTGGTDTTDDVIDDGSPELCVLVSAAGVCTYTNEGVAPTVTDAHTLGDGVPHVMRIQGINTSDLMDDTHLKSASFLFQ